MTKKVDEAISTATLCIDLDLDKELKQLELDRQDAERWRKLIRLIGSPQDGSDTIVKFFWHENGVPFILVGKNGFWQSAKDFGDFNTLIDSIPEYQEGKVGDNE